WPSQVEEQLLRVALEAVRNAVHHGKASIIRVDLRYTHDSIRLRVSDDGCGFDVDAATEGPRWGLMGMEERAKRVGGTFAVMSQPGHGTMVETLVHKSGS